MLAQLLISLSLVLFAPPSDELKELLPGLRIGEGIVEFDGTIAIDAHHPDTPDVYLEMLVTAPDSREHEALVVAEIKPSLLHAALLSAGAQSGAPITRDPQGKQVLAHGDTLLVFVSILVDNKPNEFTPIENWVVQIDSDEQLSAHRAWNGLVFAGSKLDKSGYAADRDGTLISLTSFGNEVIAPAWSVSHKAEIDEPVWIANRNLLPKQGTRVRIRIELVPKIDDPKIDDEKPTESHEPDRVDINRDM